MEVTKNITNLKNLKQGWDYGEGDIIEDKVLEKALSIYDTISKFNLNCEVHPTSEGGITLVLSKINDDVFLDLEIDNNLNLFLTKEKGISQEYETLIDFKSIVIEDLFMEIENIL